MAWIEGNGVRIRYELTGTADLPTLVLSHSLGVNLSMWDPQLDALLPHFQLLRYDTRGHGQSTIPAGPYTAADLGRDVLTLLDALRIDQACFCGLSMGGVIGQWLGIHVPKRFNKLVLANTAAKIGTDEAWNSRIATVETTGLSSVIPGTLERWFTPGFTASQPTIIAKTEAMLRATSPVGYAGCCAALRDADFRRSIQEITLPALIITGAEDPVTPPSDARFLAEAISNSTYVELPAAHLSNTEAPKAFNDALVDFLCS